ncbi:major capsid protein P2 [Pseudoalteromonas sp. M8]|uniref:major capsid protein P2 n=1 Tax=Pseudoalteromonas sp. M8 TaxID=2692624 RepID=UPI001BAA46AE|nr:major capsid protein P2 [Pseudoalteromonas sp. M8]QUI70517.1 hypothetical protein GSF13_12380 [Pseudoalteromonas sp. M8]
MSVIKHFRPSVLQLPSPTGSNYSEEWTIKLQAGLTYHSIELETNLKHVETIKKITLDIGGTPIVQVTNKMLDLLDTMYEKFKQTGRFVLDFSQHEYRTHGGIFMTELVTLLTDDVTLKIEVGTKGASDPTSPVIMGKAFVTDTNQLGRIFKPTRYELTQHAAAAGEHSWTMPNTGPNRWVQKMVFDESEVKITKVRIKRGGRTVETLTREDIDYQLQRYKGVKPQAGYLLLDFTLLGFGSANAIPTLGLNFEFEVDSNGAIKTYVQGFDQVKPFPAPKGA